MGNPQKELKFVHIAGTNGKGSIARFISEALINAGLSVAISSDAFFTLSNVSLVLGGKTSKESEGFPAPIISIILIFSSIVVFPWARPRESIISKIRLRFVTLPLLQ